MMGGSAKTFPHKLYDMLKSVCDFDSEGAFNCEENPVEWLPDGDGFMILNEQAFLEHIVPAFFSLTKMRSLTRQLNLWGFRRIPTDIKELAWQHPHFQRNDASQLSLIKRTAIKGSLPKRKKNKTIQDRHIIREEITSPIQPFPSTSMTDIGDLRSIGSSNPNAEATRPNAVDLFQMGHVDSCYRPPDLIATTYQDSLKTDLDYSVVSLEECTAKCNNHEAFSNISFANDCDVGFPFDSPVFQDDLPLPLQKHSMVAFNNSMTTPAIHPTAKLCMIHEDLGIGRDDYVVSKLETDVSELSDEKFEHKFEDSMPKIESAKQVIKTTNSKNTQEKNDVSEIDFNAFLSKYFPSDD